MTHRFEPRPVKDWEAYHAVVASAVEHAETVVEVGCGDGAVAPFPWSVFPHVRLLGVDPDPAAARHPHAESVLEPTPDGCWPLPDRSAELVLARYVLEHVEHPTRFLAEVRRVLAPGGAFVFLTPNWLHPAALASRWLPVGWKRRILGATRGVDEDDVFPTWYRMNTAGALLQSLGEAGFGSIRMETREFEPCPYIAFCRPGRWAAKAYLQGIRGLRLERYLGASILGEARLPS